MSSMCDLERVNDLGRPLLTAHQQLLHSSSKRRKSRSEHSRSSMRWCGRRGKRLLAGHKINADTSDFCCIQVHPNTRSSINVLLRDKDGLGTQVKQRADNVFISIRGHKGNNAAQKMQYGDVAPDQVRSKNSNSKFIQRRSCANLPGSGKDLNSPENSKNVKPPAGTQHLDKLKPSEVPPDSTAENLNYLLGRKVSYILKQVVLYLVEHEKMQVQAKDSKLQSLFRQVARVSTYTAALRELKHALEMYVIAGRYRRSRRQQRRRRPLPPSAGPGVETVTTNNSKSKKQHKALELPIKTKLHIFDIPKPVLLRIFSYLSQRELALNVAPVCRGWHRLARNRRFWRSLTFNAACTPYKASHICALLKLTPGLWTLDLIGCSDVDFILNQVLASCRQLRTLVLDSCTVSASLLATVPSAQLVPNPSRSTDRGAGSYRKELTPHQECSILERVLDHCTCLQNLIVAFTPHLYSANFFHLLGTRCWDMQCFLVSADETDVKTFCDALGTSAPRSKCCHAKHTNHEFSEVRLRITAVRTRNNMLRVLALRPDSELTLLQWRVFNDHATLDYFGVEAKLDFRKELVRVK